MSTQSFAVPGSKMLRFPGERKFATVAPQVVLFFVMLFTGASGVVQQYIVGTVFTYLLGNSILQITLTISVMMLGMMMGTFLQKYIRTALAEWFLATEIILVAMTAFAPVVLQWAFVGLGDDFIWFKFVYMIIPGVLVGMEIPLIMRINQRFTGDLGKNISETWAWDYLGGALGGVLWIWMLPIVPLAETSFWIAGFNLMVALILVVFFWCFGIFSGRFRGVLWSILTAVTAIVTLIGFSMVASWSPTLTQKLYDDPIIAETNTQYQNIVLTQGLHPTDVNSHDYTLWLNGNKQFSSVDEAIYHEYLVHPVMNLAARHDRVLILGGGDGLALREVLKYPDVKEVNLVDLDPGMIELATENPVLSALNNHAFDDTRITSNLDDASGGLVVRNTGETVPVLLDTGEEKVTECSTAADASTSGTCPIEPVTQEVADVSVYTVDADLFLSNQTGTWDVVIIDLPDPNSIELAKLFSMEFYAKVAGVLAPDGVVVIQSTSPYHAKETFLCIQRTMAAAGLATTPYHDNVPSFGDWGWILGSTTLSPDALYDRANGLEAFPVKTKEVEAANMQRALIFNRGWLESPNDSVSTLMNPVVFDYYTYEAWRVD